GVYGARRADLLGAALTAGGAMLLARAITNLEVRQMLGVGAGRSAVIIQKTIEVNAPVSEVFGYWQHYENFPRFMANVREVVRHTADRSRWTVAGPGGVPIEWETVVTEFVPNELIAWRTEPRGSAVAHAGRVKFEDLGDGRTRLDIRMSYNPMAGGLGHAIAALLGSDPKRQMDDDLVRFKSLIEVGKTTAHGETVHRGQLG
ncbi:MAG: SRPBCC family protein, partial [Candidatus Rokuibacteriota bacterium]